MFTSKGASRHNCVHFFDIPASKSHPKLVCFVYFHFKTCLAPQRHALFEHLNFQKCSENGVLSRFLITSKCALCHNSVHFSTSPLPKVVRNRCVLTLFTSKCASHHNDVQLFISPLASRLRTCGFGESTLRPSGATK